MMRRRLAIAGAAASVLALVAFASFEAGLERGRVRAAASAGANGASHEHASSGTSATTDAKGVDSTAAKRVLYWHDPMVPGPRFDKPGKSPFMDMQLVPMYADDVPGTPGLTIDTRLQQRLGVRTAKAMAGSLEQTISAVGSIAYNERDVVVVQARSQGYVEELLVRATLDSVRKGQPLAEIYVPEWVAAQEEYLTAKRLQSEVSALALGGLAEAAKQRMRLVGMTEEHIRHVDTHDEVQPRFTITSPIDGVVGELSARQGMAVAPGAPLFRLNGVAIVWVNAELPEAAAAAVRPGHPVEARTPGLPGTVFKGRVTAILPEVDAATRTVKARIELANPERRLVPGMFATIDLAVSHRDEAVLVPTEAIIRTGKRALVIVAQPEGRFSPVEVDAGAESDGQTEILRGVRPGDDVVVSGQFLIDSEANLKGATARMRDASPGAAEPAGATAATTEPHAHHSMQAPSAEAHPGVQHPAPHAAHHHDTPHRVDP